MVLNPIDPVPQEEASKSNPWSSNQVQTGVSKSLRTTSFKCSPTSNITITWYNHTRKQNVHNDSSPWLHSMYKVCSLQIARACLKPVPARHTSDTYAREKQATWAHHCALPHQAALWYDPIIECLVVDSISGLHDHKPIRSVPACTERTSMRHTIHVSTCS